MSHNEGRFYEAEFPKLDEVVVVQVKRIVDMGAYASLLEYNGREGMMLLSELSKRRIRSVSKLLRVGRTELCMVLRVDEEKGYIDLSKRRVTPEDASAKEESFAKAKTIHGIMRHVAQQNDVPVEQLCMKVSWPLYTSHETAYEAFRKHINGEIDIWREITWNSPGDDLSDKAEKLKEDIELDLRRRMQTQMIRLRAKIEVSCSEYEGINAIRASLMKGLEASTEELEIKIKLIAHPLFVITAMCRDKAMGLGKMNEAVELIKTEIIARSGVFSLKSAPEVVGHNEPGAGSDEGSSSGSDTDTSQEEKQDETMGELKEEELAALQAVKVDGEDE